MCLYLLVPASKHTLVANEKEEKIRRKKKEMKNPYGVPSLSKNVSKTVS